MAYEALRTLGRVDYVLLWRQMVVCWHSTEGQWVVPRATQLGAGDKDDLQAAREQIADVLELGVGAGGVFRGTA